MIKLAFFDFSRTLANDTGFGSGASFMNRGNEYDRLYEDFVSHKVNEEEFIKNGAELWQGLKEKDLVKIHSQIRLNPNAEEVLKQLKDRKIKLIIITNLPSKLAELYLNLGFSYLFGTECEIKDGIFTGRVLKMNPNKGTVIKNLCDKLGVSHGECIAVGDSRSDIEMFKVVGYDNSFAYNANEEVKKYAKHHIKDFKEIIEIIKK